MTILNQCKFELGKRLDAVPAEALVRRGALWGEGRSRRWSIHLPIRSRYVFMYELASCLWLRHSYTAPRSKVS